MMTSLVKAVQAMTTIIKRGRKVGNLQRVRMHYNVYSVQAIMILVSVRIRRAINDTCSMRMWGISLPRMLASITNVVLRTEVSDQVKWDSITTMVGETSMMIEG